MNKAQEAYEIAKKANNLKYKELHDSYYPKFMEEVGNSASRGRYSVTVDTSFIKPSKDAYGEALLYFTNALKDDGFNVEGIGKNYILISWGRPKKTSFQGDYEVEDFKY